MSLTGSELVLVTPLTPAGRPAAQQEQTTTQAIANLSGGGATGPTGATGPAGATGATGATGPTGSSSSLTITDGTHTVAGTTSLTVTGGTVGGTTPNATLDISGGGISGLTPHTLPQAATSTTLEDSSFQDTSATPNTVSAVMSDGSSPLQGMSTFLQVQSSNGFFGALIQPTAGQAGEPNLELVGYGNENYPVLGLGCANGVAGTPTQTLAGDILGQIGFEGYGTAHFGVGGFGFVLTVKAAEDWTSYVGGTEAHFFTVPIGGNNSAGKDRIVLDGAGNVILPNLPTADPHILGALFVVGPIVGGTPLALMMSTG